MSHGIQNLDTMFLTEEAWHRHPQSHVVECIGTEQIAETFAFELVATPMYVRNPEGEFIEVPNKMAQVRDSFYDDGTFAPLSVMSDSFGTPDYSERFTQAYNAIMSANADVECVSVGTLQDGRKAFMSFVLPDEFTFDLGGIEHANQFMNLGDSVDGSSSFNGSNAVGRVVCANTFSAYLIGVPKLFSIKHTKNSHNAVTAALQSLRGALAEALMAKEVADRLINTVVTEADFWAIVDGPDMLDLKSKMEDEKKSSAQAERMHDEIRARYHGDDIAHCQETAWGALQAVQGYEQHDATVKKVDRNIRHGENVLFRGQKLSTKMATALGVEDIRAEFKGRKSEFLSLV